MPENELIAGCVRQDRSSQNHIYFKYGDKVMGICKRYMKDKERAEEMVMNTFLTVFKSIAQYKSDGSFEGWILKIALNCCLMELRKKTNFNMEVPADAVQIPVYDESAVQYGDVEAMLKILPEGARIIFNLYAVEGYKHGEIAERLGISEGTSKSQLHYAKEKLKRAFFSPATNNASHER
jgi:RNA polymerase sigma-70 factor (ECF subfamily)